MDIALPGKHTRKLYVGLQRNEASILAQLRTGMARLNGYLYRIGAVESNKCFCGTDKETVKHFIFRCPKWGNQRIQLLQQLGNRKSCLSTALGGKVLSALSLRPKVYGLGRDHKVDSQGKAGKEQESTLCIELSLRFSMYKIDSDSEHDPS